MGKGGWGAQGDGGYPSGSPQASGMGYLGISNAAIHTFVAALQVAGMAVIRVALASPSPATPSGRVEALFLLHLHFSCGVVGYGYLPPIWEAVAMGEVST